MTNLQKLLGTLVKEAYEDTDYHFRRRIHGGWPLNPACVTLILFKLRPEMEKLAKERYATNDEGLLTGLKRGVK